MSASQPGYFSIQEFSDLGVLLVGGRLYTYITGTTTFKAAYTSAVGSVSHTYTSDGLGGQYIALNARGELPAPLYLAPGPYDITLKRADGSTVWTRRADPIADTPVAIFTPGLTGDDAVALTTFANQNQAARILVSRGATLNFYTTCTITDSGGTIIDLNNATVIQHTNNIDSFVFQPTTVGVTAAFLNFVGLVNGTVSHTSVAPSSTSGGVQFIQCNGFRVENITFSNCDVTISGGQLWRIDRCGFFATVGAGRGITSACVHIQEAPYGAGLYQQCFTGSIDNWIGAATQVRGNIFRIHAVDGLRIGYGYGTSGSRALINVLSDRNGSYVSDVSINGAYLDCGPSGGCPFGVLISSDASPLSIVYGVTINDCFIGNGSVSGVTNRKPESFVVSVIGGEIANFTSFAIDHSVTLTNTDFQVVGVQFSNNGTSGSAGDIRLDGGHSFNIGPNVHTGSKNVCLSITGTWVTGKAQPGVNATGVAADISYSGATFSGSPLQLDAGSSTYAGAVANSWKSSILNLTAYANNAAALAAGLQTNRLYRVGNVVQIT